MVGPYDDPASGGRIFSVVPREQLLLFSIEMMGLTGAAFFDKRNVFIQKQEQQQQQQHHHVQQPSIMYLS